MAKKGGFVDLTTMFSSGLGAYAAKNSNSVGGLIWTLAKYALVIVAILVGIYAVLGLVRLGTETFVPVAPSKEGDEKVVTPAGNVIIY
jgi:hypothetical protein